MSVADDPKQTGSKWLFWLHGTLNGLNCDCAMIVGSLLSFCVFLGVVENHDVMTCVNQKNCALLALSVSSRKHEVLTSVSKNLCRGFNAWSRWQSSETTEQHQYQFNQLKTVQCNTNNPATIICELWYKPCYGFLCLEMQQVKNYEAYNTCCKHKWYAISLSSGGASYRAKGLKAPPQFLLQPLQNVCAKWYIVIFHELKIKLLSPYVTLTLKCTKIDFFWGSTPTGLGELTLLPDPIARFKGPYF